MRQRLLIPILLLLLVAGWRAEVRANLFDPSEYAARRSRLMEKIPDGVAIFLGEVSENGYYRFFQNNDLIYFSGVEIPNAVLVVDGVAGKSVLFFSIGEREADGMGIPLDLVRKPVEVSGIEQVFPIERLASYLSRLSLSSKVFYTMFRPAEKPWDNSKETYNALQRSMTMNLWDGRLTRELQFVKRVKETFPQVTVRDCSEMVWDLRKIKSAAEIDVLRKTAQIGVRAHRALIQSTRPRVAEYKLAALFEFICRMEGAQELAFSTILMSGKNHRYGHYHQYDRILEAGDFVILDAGPDYGYYNADISTSFPASGTFNRRQKEVYQLANGIREICIKNYRPGTTLKAVGRKVRAYLLETGHNPEDPRLRGKVRNGGYNHSIGMATHDPMANFAGPDEVLKPGFVFACDIQIIYPDEELGVRLEDTVVITEKGCEVLSAGLPRTVEEVERLMAKKGLLQIMQEK